MSVPILKAYVLSAAQRRQVRRECEVINGETCRYPACDCTPRIPRQSEAEAQDAERKALGAKRDH